LAILDVFPPKLANQLGDMADVPSCLAGCLAVIGGMSCKVASPLSRSDDVKDLPSWKNPFIEGPAQQRIEAPVECLVWVTWRFRDQAPLTTAIPSKPIRQSFELIGFYNFVVGPVRRNKPHSMVVIF